ncbi:MAG: cytidylate kinase-like family protein [Oscillospiraceae bacterium]|nr:cytidylate kinase-like family protein [Oscillospiraceae bacterium]
MAEKTRIITVGRRYGSGGRIIARTVAEKLGLPFFDKDIITNAAKASGLCDSFMENFEQTPTSSMLYSLVMNAQHGGMFMNKPIELVAYEAQINAVRNAAAGGECVIVGRCADYILKDDYNVVSFFITASADKRAQTVSQREGIDLREASIKMTKMDKVRASYYNYHAQTKWGASDSYEMCISTDHITNEQAAEIMIEYLRIRDGR